VSRFRKKKRQDFLRAELQNFGTFYHDRGEAQNATFRTGVGVDISVLYKLGPLHYNICGMILKHTYSATFGSKKISNILIIHRLMVSDIIAHEKQMLKK
jgi:hypothetical protein